MRRTRKVGLILAGASALVGGCAGTGESAAAPEAGEGSPAVMEGAARGGSPGVGSVPRAPVVRRRDAWDFAGTEGVVIETAHFRVHSTAVGSAVLDRLPAFSEDALRAYRLRFAALPPPGGRMDTFLMQNRSEWELLTRHLMGERAEEFLRVRRGGFAANGRTVLYDTGMQQSLRLVGHEGWHQYTQRTFRDRLPAWLEEGMATQFEGFRWSAEAIGRAEFLPWANLERFDVLRDAEAEGRLMPLVRVLSTTPSAQLGRSDEAAIVYYAQLWALLRFLDEGEGGRHRPSLARVLEDAAEGTLETTIRRRLGLTREQARKPAVRGNALFAAYFDGGIRELSASYDRFLRELVKPGARNAVAAGRSPL